MRAIIKNIRIDLGLSQEQLGALLGVCKNTICHYETGRTEPPIYYLYSLLYLKDNLISILDRSVLEELTSYKELRTCAACGHKYKHLKKLDN
jgi:transcriptional regulator with XRE-family HTH domain